jgi:T5SS/PEP-CTERM-associated repeat protein
VTEPSSGPVVLGNAPGSYGEATVRDPGSTWTVPARLELGRQGKGTVSVTSGHLVTGNDGAWIGSVPQGEFGHPIPGMLGGLGEVTASWPGSRWVGREYLILGHTASRGTLRIADHATVAWRENPNILGSAALMVGWFGGSGAVEVLDGSTFNNGGGALIATTAAAASSASPAALLIRGLLSFEDRRAKVDLRSTVIHLLRIDRDGKTATVAGTATVNGHAGYAFEATAEDRSASGHNDRFRIVITGPALTEGGPQFHYDSAADSTTAGRIDRGGNVVIIPSRRGNDDEDDN